MISKKKRKENNIHVCQERFQRMKTCFQFVSQFLKFLFLVTLNQQECFNIFLCFVVHPGVFILLKKQHLSVEI